MDYKEKYEKTLERARKELQTCGSQDCDAARQIFRLFPELAESKDEKIRKSIIELLNEVHFTFKYYDIKKMIAWLEKQQKPADKIQLGKKYKCIASPRYSTFMRGEIYKPEDKFLCSLMNFCSDCFEPIEDSEQKPAEDRYMEGYLNGINDTLKSTVWSEEDEENLNWFDKFFRAESVIAEGKDIPQDRYLWFKNLKGRVQPKQEWSEEDESWFKEIELMCLNFSNNTDYREKFFTWLKSIEDRVKPQPKQEWSEEDKNMLQSILDEYKSMPIEKRNWLKSLSPQSQWRPSENELEVLRLAAEKDGTCLMGLYENLKKLKDEK